ncbi:MAG: hypothetical protein P9L92_12750 [Candidatus Electryonea clarkiae]|nr:hypothetical protein [Candidatus Electryonea clarkiae]MDP8289314.1 hypothetical protein [Candidatus Electryonea clarkiae]
MFRFFVRAIVFIILLVVASEIALRTVVHASLAPYAKQDNEFNIMHYDTSKTRTGIFSVGRLAQEQGHWRVNNYGWNSIFDYVSAEKRDKPLIAVIGDSYTNALLCDTDQRIDWALKEQVGNKYDVYSFGYGGIFLAGTIDVAPYVEKYFDPDVVVFLITKNTVKNSLKRYDSSPLHKQLRHTGEGIEEVPPGKYRAVPYRRLARKSALVRYIMLNTYIFQDPLDEDNSTDSIDQNEEKIIQDAADYIVTELNDKLPGKELVFLVDMDRVALYDDENTRPEHLKTSLRLEKACQPFENCHVLDLTDPFYQYYHETSKKLNFKNDTHWNPTAYRIAAETIYSFLNDRLLTTSQE